MSCVPIFTASGGYVVVRITGTSVLERWLETQRSRRKAPILGCLSRVLHQFTTKTQVAPTFALLSTSVDPPQLIRGMQRSDYVVMSAFLFLSQQSPASEIKKSLRMFALLMAKFDPSLVAGLRVSVEPFLREVNSAELDGRLAELIRTEEVELGVRYLIRDDVMELFDLLQVQTPVFGPLDQFLEWAPGAGLVAEE